MNAEIFVRLGQLGNDIEDESAIKNNKISALCTRNNFNFVYNAKSQGLSMNESDNNSNLKDLYGEQYVKAFASNQSAQRIKKLCKYMHLRKQDHVADYGCGNGMLMPLIAPAVGSYTGIDFSESFIEAAHQRAQSGKWDHVQFCCSTIQDFCNNHRVIFDHAFALDFSEHVYDGEWKDILIHIRQSLKPGGKLYLHTPNADFFIEKMKSHHFILKQFPEHIAVRNTRQNIALLKDAGFSTLKVRLLPHYLSLLKPFHLLSFLPWAGKFFRARIFIEAVNAQPSLGG